MAHGPITRSSLLLRLRDADDQEAWGHFVRLYGPLVYRFARRRGLQDSDCGDVTQEVLGAVLTNADRLGQISQALAGTMARRGGFAVLHRYHRDHRQIALFCT